MKKNEIEKPKKFRNYLWIFLLAIVLWAATIFIMPYLVGDDIGKYGDMFGSINALFSGLAFAALVVTLVLQREELTLQRKELELTRKEFAKQTVTMKATLEASNKSLLLQYKPKFTFETQGPYNGSESFQGSNAFFKLKNTGKPAHNIKMRDKPEMRRQYKLLSNPILNESITIDSNQSLLVIFFNQESHSEIISINSEIDFEDSLGNHYSQKIIGFYNPSKRKFEDIDVTTPNLGPPIE